MVSLVEETNLVAIVFVYKKKLAIRKGVKFNNMKKE
jgi:hypothetical protein